MATTASQTSPKRGEWRKAHNRVDRMSNGGCHGGCPFCSPRFGLVREAASAVLNFPCSSERVSDGTAVTAHLASAAMTQSADVSLSVFFFFFFDAMWIIHGTSLFACRASDWTEKRQPCLLASRNGVVHSMPLFGGRTCRPVDDASGRGAPRPCTGPDRCAAVREGASGRRAHGPSTVGEILRLASASL